ncbi:MAG: tetratricopeptide repeat protein [Candidatus Nitrotoga sp.]
MNHRTSLLHYFRQRDRGWMLSLFAWVGIVYLPFLGNPFIFDDANIIRADTLEHLAHGGFQFGSRWLSYASLGWTYVIFGDTLPHFYHAGNLLLHTATVITLFYFLRQIISAVIVDTKNESKIIAGAWLGAAIFALHPVATYAVGYIVQRSIVMATLFVLLMQLAYLRGLLSGQKRWLVLAVLAYFFAGLSKEHSLLAPLLLVAQMILVRGQIRTGKWALWLTWMALAIVGTQILLLAKGIIGVSYEVMATNLFAQQRVIENISMLHVLSVLTQAGLFFKYLGLWLLPNPTWMSIDMREPFVTSLSAWLGWLGAVSFLIYGMLASWLLLRPGWMGLIGFALLYPWLQFPVEFSSVRVQEPFVLYRSYLWMPGMMLLIPVLLIKWPHKKILFALGFAGLLLLPLAWNRMWVMGDNYRLWNDAATLLSSEHVAGADRIFFNRGIAPSPDKKQGEAIADLERSVKLSPHLAPLHYVLGVEYFNAIRYQDAMVQFDETIRLDPQNGHAYYVKGLILKRQRDDKQAIQQMKKSCELKNTAACIIVGMSNSANSNSR